MTKHETTTYEGKRSTLAGSYWWLCTCGEEAGPYEFSEHADDDAGDHENRENGK